MFVYIFYSYYF